MANLVNGILIGLVGFFLLLLVFWYAVEIRADDEVGLGSIQATWGAATPQGTPLEVEGHLNNPRRSDLQATAVTYRVILNGDVVAEGEQPVDVTVPPRGRDPLRFTVVLPPDFPHALWQAYASSRESLAFAVEGDITTVRNEQQDDIPYRWGSTWQGGLSDRFGRSVRSCPAPEVCVRETEGGWHEGDLAVLLHLQADAASPALVHGGHATLLLDGRAVAQGTLPSTLVEAGGRETAGVRLQLDRAAWAAWWPRHVAACESSTVALRVQATVETYADDDGQGTPTPEGTEVREHTWTLQAQPFRTRIACRA